MRRNNLFWGALLILVGSVLVLDNLGYLSFLKVSIWQLLWPLGLITLGVWVLWGSSLYKPSQEIEELALPLADTEQAKIFINYQAGELQIQGAAPSGELIAGSFGGGVKYHSTQDSAQTKLKLSNDNTGMQPWTWWSTERSAWTIALSDRIPLQLTIKTGASNNRIDLTDLKVTQLKIDTGASSTNIHLPQNAGYTQVSGSSGAAALTLHIPEGVAARIRTQGGLASIQIDQTRFPLVEGAYQSPNYASAENKAEIQIDMGVGSVNVI